MSSNIPESKKKRIVIVGGGFGGLTLAEKLKNSSYQIILIDKLNYHQFPPLLYQVSTSGLEPSAISFPYRKIFQRHNDFYFRKKAQDLTAAEGAMLAGVIRSPNNYSPFINAEKCKNAR